MAVLLELKENFKRFYNKYDIYIVPVAKFIAALVSFLMLIPKTRLHGVAQYTIYTIV